MNILITVIGSFLISLGISTTINANELSGKMPDFTLAQAYGPDVRLDELKGQVVMLNFWATWCAPCRQEMPALEALHKNYNKAGFTILGINIENSANPLKRKEIEDFITAKNLTFPILYDHQKVVTKTIEKDFLKKSMGMPTTVFLDRRGNARFYHEADKLGDEAKYEKVIKVLLGE